MIAIVILAAIIGAGAIGFCLGSRYERDIHDDGGGLQ